MKKFKAFKAVLCTVLAAVLLIPAVIAAEGAPALSGESSRTVKEIYPGVVHTQIKTPSNSVYSNQSINVVQFDLAQRDLYLDTFYYNNDARKLALVTSDIAQYNQTHSDRKAIAAINGDMWMVSYAHARIEGKGTSFGGYSDAVVKKELTVSRSYNIVDGEIFTSGTIPQETPYAGISWAFGITDDYVPLLGQPTVSITAKDETNGSSLKIDGINRLPANNAIVMYTDRVMSTYKGFALDDAYEILIEFNEDYTPAHGMDVTGTVKAVYSKENGVNPDYINEKQMILTSRGSKVSSLSEFAVGDSINITLSVGDACGNAEGWRRVKNSIGGNIVYVQDGVLTGNGVESGYPATLIGYDFNKKINMITMDGRGYGGAGANGARLAQLCKDLKLYDLLLLDGGGSMTMVVSDGTSYKPVSHAVDSKGTAYRTVNNAVVLAYGPERGEQGKFEIEVPIKVEDPLNVTFPTEKHVKAVVGAGNQALFGWEDGNLALTVNDMNTAPGMADPYIPFSYQNIDKKVSANEYKFITLVYKLPESNSQKQYMTELFCQCEGRGAEGGQSVSGSTKRTGKYEYTVFNAGSLSKWKGTISGLRIDFFYGAMANGDKMLVHNIMLHKTKDEATAAAKKIVAELNGEPEETTAPVTTAPVTTEPVTTEPVTTAPTTTAPVTTEPAVSDGETVPYQPTDTEETDPVTSHEWITTEYTETEPNGTDTYTVTESATEPDTESATESATDPGTVSDTSDLIPVGSELSDGTAEPISGSGTDTARTQDPESTDSETSDTAGKGGRNTALTAVIIAVASAAVAGGVTAVILKLLKKKNENT